MSNQLPLPDRAAFPERRVAEAHRRPSRRERGQALVLIAVAFVGLAAFIGLAVDAGILFTQIGHLRRAVDAAALGAANQFREGRTVAELTAAATEFINLNSVSTGTAEVFICEEPFTPGGPYSPAHDPTLCPSAGDPYRKFVRVEGEVIVNFAFLPIIGFYSVPIRADAISETAAVDLVLVIDTSPSMSYELCYDETSPGVGRDNDGDFVANDCPGQNGIAGPDPAESDVPTCNNNRLQRLATSDAVTYPPENDCHPFEEVRAAAQAMLQRMYFPYDRMAVVTFSRVGSVRINLADGDDPVAVSNTIDGLLVDTNPFITGEAPCDPSAGDPRGCGSTNVADGLMVGGNLFGDPNADGVASAGEIRQEAVWILILLGDGAANAAYHTDGGLNPNVDRDAWFCPNPSALAGQPNWLEPLCTDIDPSNTPSTTFGVGRHDNVVSPDLFDPDDAARDMADFVGCPDANSPQPAACPEPGQAAVIFAIGLGPEVTETRCDDGFYGLGPTCGNLGEQLLRYIAGAGDDANPGTPPAQDPCNGAASGDDCGNYYYSPSGAGLLRVFEAIASRIFTRLTH